MKGLPGFAAKSLIIVETAPGMKFEEDNDVVEDEWLDMAST